MLDINFIRQNSEKVKEACFKKQVDVNVDKILELDKRKRELLVALENLKAEQNKISRPAHNGFAASDAGRGGKENNALISQARELKDRIKETEPQLNGLNMELQNLLILLPNIPFEDVPVGKDDKENVVLRQSGKPPKFNFPAKDHLKIGENLGLVDTERAGKVAGSRFAYLKNEIVLLEFALINFVFDILKKHKFIPVLPPVMLKEEMAMGTGYFEAADKNEAYFFPQDELFLTGTSEQSLIAMHSDEILEEKSLPLRYAAFSTCFRREAGSYGKDTRGILRVHQFDKIEMVIFSKPEDSEKEHKLLLSIEEKMMKKLGLPYQVVNICTGDLGRPAARKYDIETWLPSEGKYRETHSTSNCTDFQARRLNIRYRDKSGKLSFVHTLNGTAFAIGRILIGVIENYQQKDGSVKVPKALQKYAGFKTIK
ncbi:MAG: serine--tRNA ligase [Candidatus Staskawiczbacteria bacterium]|nr:serine--tRNA ligase [Candidatus Staskawiczbacteria bacterium]